MLGRVANDLRVSVTDRCNLRCTYCMPTEGLAWLPKRETLSFEEIVRLVEIFVGLGVRSIKVTGGEPTVRSDLPVLVGMLRALGSDLDISMTTNGILLDRMAGPLAEAGLNRVNVSCDSLLRGRFEEITRRDALQRVFAGMAAAEEAGLTPLKINCVVIAGTSDGEIVDFARWSRDTGREVRFIEYMPLDAAHRWGRAKVVPSRTVLRTIAEVFPLEPVIQGPEPATNYRFADSAAGGIGVIGPVSQPFCDTCNRLRLSAAGMFRSCLFSLDETDLRTPLRAGAVEDELVDLIRSGVWAKWSGHRINHPAFVRPDKSMAQIGG